jgi:hypothetical protein
MSENNNPFVSTESSRHTDDWELFDDIDSSCDTIDRNVRYAMKLHDAQEEYYYTVAGKVLQQIKTVRPYIKKLDHREDRREMHERLTRAKYVISFLNETAPYLEGSGVLGSTNPRRKIESMTLGGLPGQGKRR